MNTNLLISIIGIVATTGVGTAGLYFTYKARSIHLKSSLFSKQLSLLIRFVHKQGRVKVNAVLLSIGNKDQQLFAYENLKGLIVALSELEDECAVLLPVEMYMLAKEVTSSTSNMIEQFEVSNEVDISAFNGLAMKFALLARELVGADKLTDDNISLFSKTGNFQKLYDLADGLNEIK